MNRIIIMGSGAANGVPSVSKGWGSCNPHNRKNIRMRAGNYVEYEGLKFLIDTGPDLRTQLLNNNIKDIDFVLYTHAHADHLHGIDELRSINRLKKKALNFYATRVTTNEIKRRFHYLISGKMHGVSGGVLSAKMVPNIIKVNQAFYIKGVKIVPIKLLDHHAETVGYVFDDGEFVFISDFKRFSASALKAVKKQPKLLVIPLTCMEPNSKHAALKEILSYINIINPEKTILNHMSTSTDYDEANSLTPLNVYPAWDGMIMEF